MIFSSYRTDYGSDHVSGLFFVRTSRRQSRTLGIRMGVRRSMGSGDISLRWHRTTCLRQRKRRDLLQGTENRT